MLQCNGENRERKEGNETGFSKTETFSCLQLKQKKNKYRISKHEKNIYIFFSVVY